MGRDRSQWAKASQLLQLSHVMSWDIIHMEKDPMERYGGSGDDKECGVSYLL